MELYFEISSVPPRTPPPPSKISKLLLVHELCISGGLEEHWVPTTPRPSCGAVGWNVVCVEGFGWRGVQAPLCLPAAPPCWETRHPLQEVQHSASPVPQGESVYVTRKHIQTLSTFSALCLLTINQMHIHTNTQLPSTFCLSAYDWSVITTLQTCKGQEQFQSIHIPRKETGSSKRRS